MSGIKGVLLAIDLATRKRDQASQDLLQVRQTHLVAQDQMAQLETYAGETASRWASASQISTTPELMRHHYQFLGRLQHAIDLQRTVLAASTDKVELAKRVVLDAEFRLISLKQVLKKKQADLAVLQVRREQKQMDEFAALSGSQARTGHITAENGHEY